MCCSRLCPRMGIVGVLLLVTVLFYPVSGLHAQQQGGGAFSNSKTKTPARQSSVKKKRSKPVGSRLKLPALIRIADKGRWGTFRAQFRKSGRNSYTGRWSHGVVTTMTVLAFNSSRIRLRRTDKRGHLGSVTGTYSGRMTSPNRASGTSSLSNGSRTKWTASW